MNPNVAYNLEIQRFLRSFRTIEEGNEDLVKNFKIDVRQEELILNGTRKEHVWLYNYDPIKSRGNVKIENEARGLVLDRFARIVSMSFPRFFNAHEPYAAEIDWGTARAEMKYDGSLVVIYPFQDTHRIQTRRRAFADGSVGKNSIITFAEMVTGTLKEKFGKDPFKPFNEHNKSEKYCFVFEFIGPHNRIVTPYEKNELVFLTAFNRVAGAEIIRNYVDMFAAETGFKRPATIKVSSMEEAHSLIDTLDDLAEGIVIADHRNRRIKLKKQSYLSVSKLVKAGGQLSPRNFADIVLNGDADEVIGYFDEFAEILNLYQITLEGILDDLDDAWEFNKDAETRKEFANRVKEDPLSHILFAAWDGKVETTNDVLPLIKPEFLVKEVEERYGEFYQRLFGAVTE